MRGHLHRIASPRISPVLRRISEYIVKPMAGAHPKDEALPLGVLLRDVLKVTTIMRESKKVLNSRHVMVDGKIRTNYKLPVGLMDVIYIIPTEKAYRITFNTLGKIQAKEIPQSEMTLKLCKVLNKTKVKGGKTQLNLHDGRNILTDDETLKTGDTIVLDLSTGKIVNKLPLQKGMLIYVMRGTHIGEVAKLVDIIQKPGAFQDKIVLELPDGSKFETLKKYAFVIGKDKPEVSI